MQNGFCLYEAGKEIQEPVGRIALVEGQDCTSITRFIELLARQFEFPEYYNDTLDSLEELLNDLSWLRDRAYGIAILHYKDFLKDEGPNRKSNLLELLHTTAQQWKSVPNYPGEEDFRDNAAFHIYVEKTAEVMVDLHRLNIPYELM